MANLTVNPQSADVLKPPQPSLMQALLSGVVKLLTLRLNDFSIAAKIILANSFLALVTGAALCYLVLKITAATAIIEHQSTLVDGQKQEVSRQGTYMKEQRKELEQLTLANEVLREFTDARYWLFDLSVSWLNESEQNAEQAMERLGKLLDRLAVIDAPLASQMRTDTQAFYSTMINAVDAYVGGNRVLANSLVAEAKKDGLRVETQLNQFLTTAQQNADTIGHKVEQAAQSVAKASDEVHAAADDVKKTNNLLQWLAITVTGVVACITLMAALALRRSITRPVLTMLAAVEDLCSGEGDLTRRLPVFSGDEIGRTATAFNGFLDKLHHVIAETRHSIDALAAASEEVKSSAQSLSDCASQQAAGVEETSSALEEMIASITGNAASAKTTDAIAAKAATEAKDGGRAVAETVLAIEEIAAKISIVDDIAYKTNLLALNATIEAARAGKVGRCFAVVATEVSMLADRSAEAAKEIGALANASTVVASRAGQLLKAIVPNVEKTAGLVQEIAAASSEQAAGVEQISASMGLVDKAAQANAASSEQLAATAHEISERVQHLRQMVSFFKVAM